MKAKSLILATLFASGIYTEMALAEKVQVFSWENTRNGQLQSTQKMYSSGKGMIAEEISPSGEVQSEMVLLPEGKIIINDMSRQTSIVMDPNNMPGLGGAGSAQSTQIQNALAEARRELDAQLANMTPEQRAQMEKAMQQFGGAGAQGGAGAILDGLLGGGQTQTQPPPRVRETGNSGTDNGMRWNEVEVTLMGNTYLYRLTSWSNMEGAETLSDHYQSMSEIFNEMMSNIGLGNLMQNIQAWPEELNDYMTGNEVFPIYVQNGNNIQRLIEVSSDDINDGRFAARFEIQSRSSEWVQKRIIRSNPLSAIQ